LCGGGRSQYFRGAQYHANQFAGLLYLCDTDADANFNEYTDPDRNPDTDPDRNPDTDPDRNPDSDPDRNPDSDPDAPADTLL
jgi:hypothetical protein